MNRQRRGLDIPTMLHTAAAVRDEVETKLSAIGLSGAKFAALKALSDAGEVLPLSQLAGRLSCVKSNVTQLVDRLETEGLVARKADPQDRRTRLAELTAAGRTAVAKGTRVMQGAEQSVLGRLTADEARQLGELLGKLNSTS
jgi:DNA-binding MarR family transcriptional regulator